MSNTGNKPRVLVSALIIILLVVVFTGPYAFVYLRTATWTFPRIDERDFNAFEKIETSVSPVANLTSIRNVEGAQEANYLVNMGVFDRKFLDWIGFPLVLEVNDFTFNATGVSQGNIVFECSHSVNAFPRPTGFEPWFIYQVLVDRYDDHTLDVSCRGDASVIDPATQPIPLTMNYSISATLVGDRNYEVRTWNNSQSMEIRDVRSM